MTKIGEPIREIDVQPVKREEPSIIPAEPTPERNPKPHRIKERPIREEPVKVPA